MKGTPEQLVGSLAERTPDSQSVMNVHHMGILKGELSGQLKMDTVAIHVFDEETRLALKREYDKVPILGILILWTRFGAGKLGIQKFEPIKSRESIPNQAEYEEWEAKAINDYLDRHNL